jgi:hypothetical protein
MSYTSGVAMTMRAMLLAAALLPQDAWLPLQEGARWTYVVEDVGAEASGGSKEVVAEVGGVESEWIAVSNYLGYRRCWLRATAEGVDLKIDPKPEAAVLTILKTSARAGDTWKGTLGKETVTFTLRGEEALERGDTRVKALHVEFSAAVEKHPGHTATHGDVWFAAGIGVVRAQLTTDLDCHTSLTKVYQLKP